MPRSIRQSKILEIITNYEVETQDDLVTKLKELNFDATQATISRDIKELGLIKVASSKNGKYKYAFAETLNQTSNKYLILLKESIISMKVLNNFVILKTLKDLAISVSAVIDKFDIQDILGCVNGNDTVLMIFSINEQAQNALNKLENIINS